MRPLLAASLWAPVQENSGPPLLFFMESSQRRKHRVPKRGKAELVSEAGESNVCSVEEKLTP